MIPAIIFSAVTATVGFLGGCLWGGLSMVNKLEAAEQTGAEYKRRLNRILETERTDVEQHPKLQMLYSVAKGERV
ncbi:hypothetical protein [Sphingobium lactosutens]|jgi:hypothetical protein|uniref:hypothetical protein n=1 Tax=Sphingobium lactosutens TaxID=522773 RepID=UPI001D18711E|nr:hypothetical protein [Sphingobium lactosutens]MCC4258035.1 hypothetical protein [Sphingobium lactosutens]